MLMHLPIIMMVMLVLANGVVAGFGSASGMIKCLKTGIWVYYIAVLLSVFGVFSYVKVSLSFVLIQFSVLVLGGVVLLLQYYWMDRKTGEHQKGAFLKQKHTKFLIIVMVPYVLFGLIFYILLPSAIGALNSR